MLSIIQITSQMLSIIQISRQILSKCGWHLLCGRQEAAYLNERFTISKYLIFQVLDFLIFLSSFLSFLSYTLFYSLGMMASTGDGKSDSLSKDIQVKKSIPFFETRFNSYRAEIAEIHGKSYVAIAKFWKPPGASIFIPSKSVFIPMEAWYHLRKASFGISLALDQVTTAITGIFFK